MQPHMNHTRTVTIPKEKLVAKMKENRLEHELIYKEALGGYYTELRNTLEDLKMSAVELLGTGDWEDFNEEELLSPLQDLEKPVSYLKAYDEAIELFSWDTGIISGKAYDVPLIELSVSEFRKYVLDQWDWQGHFLASNARHSATAVRKSSRM